MMRALALLVLLATGAACRTTTRERFGGLWSDELVRAARYLPAGFDACRITTLTLLGFIEDGALNDLGFIVDGALNDARMLTLTAARWSARGKYERVEITCVGHVARVPLDHPDRLDRILGLRVEKIGRAGDVDMFHVAGSGGQLFDYQAEVDGLRLAANDLDILRDALMGMGSLDAVLSCCVFPPLYPGAELLQVVRVDENGIRGFATYAGRESPEEVRVVIDADDLTAARQHLLAHWSEDIRQHARATEDGVIVAVPRPTSPDNTLLWASRVQALSGVVFFDDL